MRDAVGAGAAAVLRLYEERAAELREHLRRAEEDRDRLCRVYTALGAGTGALLTILLI